jgi:predicted nucleic acid-binding Zn ribbon protein
MTKSELLALLRDAHLALEGALYGETAGPADTLARIGDALRAEAVKAPDEICPVCGNAVTQPATGRPRTYCGDTCKKRAQRQRNAPTTY